MKPSGPAAAVAAPASKAMMPMPASLAAAVLMPSPAATSSPKFKIFNCGPVANARISPTTMNGRIPSAMFISRPAREPTVQKRIRSRLFSLVSTKALVMALKTADNAAPPSTKVKGSTAALPAEARPKTSAVAAIAPRKAITAVAHGAVMPNSAKLTTTLSAAPELTPRIPGSARGLRVWPWIRAPATPSAAPTIMARMVRGSRSSATTRWLVETSSWAPRAAGSSRSAAHTSSAGMERAPYSKLQIVPTRTSKSRAPRPRRRVVRTLMAWPPIAAAACRCPHSQPIVPSEHRRCGGLPWRASAHR